MQILTVNGLCKNYPEFRLKNVSFTVESGQIMGFVGRNGAGKSTTIKAMLNMIHGDSGSAEILGMNVAENETECKKNIGVTIKIKMTFDGVKTNVFAREIKKSTNKSAKK